jgi:hypothetical protein
MENKETTRRALKPKGGPEREMREKRGTGEIERRDREEIDR